MHDLKEGESGGTRLAAGSTQASRPAASHTDTGRGKLPGRGLLLAGACGGFLLVGMTFAMVGPTLLAISETFGVAVASAGVLFTAQSFGYLSAVFGGGLISDAIGHRTVLLSGLGLLVAALFTFALAPVWALALAIMVCVGLGFGLAEVTMNASVSDAYPERRGWALNLIHMFFGVGALIAPTAVGLTARWDVSWRPLYMAVAAFGVLALLLFTRPAFPQLHQKDRAPVARTLGHLLRRRRFVMIAILLGLYIGSEVTTAGWGFTYLVKYREQSETYAGLILSLFWIGLVAGRMLSTWIVERVNYAVLILVASTAAFATLTLTLTSGHPGFMATGFALTGFFLAPLFATILALGQRSYPHSSGLVSGLIITVGGIGGAIFPWLAGQLSRWTDLRVSVLFGGLLSLALAVVISIILVEDRKACRALEARR